MTYKKRLVLLMGLDSIIVFTSIFLSSYILYDTYNSIFDSIIISAFVLLISHHIIGLVYGLYNKAWEYASTGELFAIVNSVSISILITGFIQYYFFGTMLLRALVVTWMLHIILIGGSRLSWKVLREHLIPYKKDQKRTLIIGAGAAGSLLARQLTNNHESELRPVVFLDDDFSKKKLRVYGVKVAGTTEDIAKIVSNYRIDHIVIAIPSLKNYELKRIFNLCAETNVKTQIMPKFEDIITGKLTVNQFRDVEVEDLLGRDTVDLDMASVSDSLTNETILVTGAGGSIGSEICRQVANFEPAKLILLGHGENSIYQIDMELKNKFGQNLEVIPIIADIKDRERIFEVMQKFKPQVVYHAAAHKHVPLMEYNPMEAIKNNILGTKNVVEAANSSFVDTFVLVSSDKAVNPTNVMGATKRVAEMIIQSLDQKSDTKFVAVRFGNVLGSRGSVIPLFKKQIQSGGPVTVTHPEMTRYFMTIPEASRLVIQAGVLARGGEIFVLDMGEPVKIAELAKNLIYLSGFTESDIPIEYTGIRPGEKMYEELLGEDEVTKKEVFPKIYIGKATYNQKMQIETEINALLKTQEEKLKGRLMTLIKQDQKNIYKISN